MPPTKLRFGATVLAIRRKERMAIFPQRELVFPITPPAKIGAFFPDMFVRVMMGVFLFLALSVPTPVYGQNLSLSSQTSGQNAVSVSQTLVDAASNVLHADIQIQNTSGTWVYIEQDQTVSGTSNPVTLPENIYLLGPGGVEDLGKVTFNGPPFTSYLKFKVTTPLGLDFTDPLDPKCSALFGAEIIDFMIRGLFTTATPPESFDNISNGDFNPLNDLIADIVLENASDFTALVVAVKNHDVTGSLAALNSLVQDCAENDALKADVSTLLSKIAPENVGAFFDNVDSFTTFFGSVFDFVDVKSKFFLLAGLTTDTFGAPPVSTNEIDVVLPYGTTAPTKLTANAISTNQINLNWPSNSTSGIGFIIQRAISGSGPWTFLSQVGASASAFSNTTGLSASTTYFYRVGSFNSVTFNNPSWSNIASAITKSVAVVSATHTLTINSSNPASGAYIYMSTDKNGSADGNTPFQRVYNSGASVALVSSGSVGSSPFIKWQKDGQDYPSSGTIAYVTMDADHTMTAVYGSTGTTHTLIGIAINGPTAIAESTSQQYSATAFFSDGSSQAVNPTQWSLNSGAAASITSSGLLDAGAVNNDMPVTITAGYGSQTATKTITITSTNAVQTYSLTLNYNDVQGAVTSGVGNTYVAGSTVQLNALPNYGYHFVSWGGDVSGTSTPINVVMNGNKTVSATFASGDNRQGTVSVTILPPEAATAGVQWGFNASDYRASGTSYSTYPGTYFLTLHPVAGWLGPVSQQATITAGATNNVTVTSRKIPRLVRLA